MASKVMATTNSTNSDLVHQTSATNTYSLQGGGGDQSKNFGSMNMDELLRNFCNDNNNTNNSTTGAFGVGGGDVNLSRQESFPKTAAEVWKDITGGGGDDDDVDRKEEKIFNEMTLEEFLAKTGTIREEDVRIPTVVGPVTGFVVESPYPQGQIEVGGSILGFGNGTMEVGGGRGVGRGKRKAIQEPMDKVAQQRQRRMIKNRESAARSRERKQAYTVELESQVSQLLAENERLTNEQKERNKERYRQLMETRIPVEEKLRPQPVFELSKWNSSNTPMETLYPVEEKPKPQLVFEPSKRDLFNAPTPYCLFRGRKKDLRRTNSMEW
ncbi:hypothetical protein MKW94_028047 [Papaver nudicaule]|uniref:BZIP domain-containing protein n=1 Tax=Papaver nudicaule TaxID=74823 RepID=A0AA41RXA7_PAPNU|nr:hypothetical protein [Papaver nudicaule]